MDDVYSNRQTYREDKIRSVEYLLEVEILKYTNILKRFNGLDRIISIALGTCSVLNVICTTSGLSTAATGIGAITCIPLSSLAVINSLGIMGIARKRDFYFYIGSNNFSNHRCGYCSVHSVLPKKTSYNSISQQNNGVEQRMERRYDSIDELNMSDVLSQEISRRNNSNELNIETKDDVNPSPGYLNPVLSYAESLMISTSDEREHSESSYTDNTVRGQVIFIHINLL
ncbi:unnamed protein product [Mytilus coruscus]|uniref:Uncharacterized protein n=1 Tax=Mytilus coruscus TaxID=42192 RepID=A0A6J8AC62_MYTCO|nr:unnamed protein product [Mytilus coruscus]